MNDARYKIEQVDGLWFIYDAKHPDREPYGVESEEEAKLTARIWNLLASPQVWE